MNNSIRLLVTLLFFSVFGYKAQTNYSSLVNPFIGTGGHGHTFPGAVLPFGMVQLSPDTRVDGSWDGCSGYHYSDNIIYGFSHTHLSGTGCSDWGDLLIMPTVGAPTMDNKVYSSKFSHLTEKASPGYYEVKLEDDKIKAELTVTPRVGIHRYTFPATKEANILLDVLHRDKTLDCTIYLMDSVTIAGYRVSEAWAKKQYVYFYIKLSKPYQDAQLASNKTFMRKFGKFNERAEGAYFRFDMSDGLPLMLKVGISSTGVAGAKKNLETEAQGWDFEKYKSDAAATWNKQLQKIEVPKTNKEKATTFYTALYHCFIHPSLNMDVDNQYRGRDNKIYTAEGFTNYSVFSLWDTHRALHPLFTILEKKRSADFINSFLNQYKQAGRLPVWELSSNETDCMIGYHSVSVIADAMQKGITGFDATELYTAAKAASHYTGFGIPAYSKNGFLQIDDESESVSKTLEYGYDDWCIAQMALQLNNTEDYFYYLKRSQAYRNLFDTSSSFMRPRKNGNWLSPFYPAEINNHFTEGNSWQYSFYVPHDMEGLIKLHVRKDHFEKKLDELFTTKEKTIGREQADITGLIGQYAHGNEPSHHMAYLYTCVGKPQKTIERVHQICTSFYKNTPDGLIGNEDCGQMSAWYVFSAMGFYPVCPGSPYYSLGEPLFKSTKINLENGKTFVINSDASPNKPVMGLMLNGQIQMMSFLEHQNIVSGGKLDFVYTLPKEAKEVYGYKTSPSFVTLPPSIPAPLIKSQGQVFKDKLEISIQSLNTKNATCYYTLDGTEPTKSSASYKQAFVIDKNTNVRAKAYSAEDSSTVSEAIFFKIKYDVDILINSKANAQYAADGPQTMIDGIIASEHWRKGNWLGYQSQDFECLVDLKQTKELSYLSLNFLQDSGSWIIFPSTVSFYASTDNLNFSLLENVACAIKPEDQKTQVYKFEKQLVQKINVRYIKIVAKNFGKLPDWHLGKGGDAFIFVDELEIK
jgi:predicted alpha-1,2-mannosidase